MKRKYLIKLMSIVLIISLIFLYNFYLRNTLSQEEKIEDFNYLYEVLKENYPYFELLEKDKNYDWLVKYDVFIDRIKNSNDDVGFYNTLNDIIKSIDDKHVNLLDASAYRNMKKVLNNMPKEYEAAHEPWLEVINNKASSKAYSRFESLIELEEEDNNNFEKQREIEIKIIEANKVAYIKINSFSDTHRIENQELLINFWKETEKYSNVIIDIRGNNGGSDLFWMNNIVSPLINEKLVFETYSVYMGGDYSMPFIESWDQKVHPIEDLPKFKFDQKYDFNNLKYYMNEELVIEPNKSINFNGKIYILIDQVNYSAADTFCAFSKATDFATLVGEETSGGGIGFSPIIVKLPNSSLIVRFPIDMALNPDGTINVIEHTKPDIKSEKPLGKVMSIIDNQN